MTAALPLRLTTAPFWARLAAVAGGAGVMALASQAAIPMQPLPLTLQTLALFVLAAVLGGSLTLRAVLIWLTAAALGAPVLADGEGGAAALFGPAQGYLFGMAVAGALAGHAAARRQDVAGLFAIFLVGHAVVLAVGWLGLLERLPPREAFVAGVLPFLPGAALKSLAAAGLVRLVALALARHAALRADA